MIWILSLIKALNLPSTKYPSRSSAQKHLVANGALILTPYLLVILLLLGRPSAAFAQPAGPDKIVVGVSLPLTGDGANIGTAVKNGVQLAYEELNPLIKNRLQLVYEDDQNSPKNAVSAFTKLTKSNHSTAIITCASNTSKATAPLADRERIPQISIATDTAVSQGKAYVVNFWATADQEAGLAVTEAQRRGYKSIAIATSMHDFNVSCRKSFQEQAAGRFHFPLSEDFAPEIKDFRPFLTKLKGIKTDGKSGVDAIFVNLFLGQIGLFAKQARELGIEHPLFAFELFEDPSEVKNSAGALVGQWYVQADDPGENFLKKYKERFPSAPNLGAANGYDSLNLIAHAMNQGKTTSASINEFLHSAQDITGALGTYSATGKNTFSLPVTLKVVTKDGFAKM